MPTSVGPEIVVECDLKMEWACSVCTCLNEAGTLACTACGVLAPHPPGSWECLACSAGNPEHALKCNVCDASLVLQTGGWLCRICVPHEPVAQGELMCLQGHHQDGLIYGRGRRGASTVSGQQTQEGSKSKRPKVAGCAPECNGGDGQESDEETGQPEDRDPVRPKGLVAASRAMSAEIVADLPACAVIKGLDVVECQRCGQPAVRPHLHNQGECSPCCAEMPVCKPCGLGDPGNCSEGYCKECCAQQGCCGPTRNVSAPATSPRMCGCNPQCTGEYECEGCSWSESCVWRVEVHEAACSEFQRKVMLNVVPEEVPVRHCQCSGYWPHSVTEECYDRQAGQNMCECTDGGIPHIRGQLNKCQRCNGWLEEVWRSKEPTRTFLRFMISRLRDRSDSALGDRFELHVRHAAIVSHYFPHCIFNTVYIEVLFF